MNNEIPRAGAVTNMARPLSSVIALVLLAAFATSPAHGASDAGDEMKLPHPGMRLGSTTPMEKEMHALQAGAQRLKSEMDTIAGTTDASERKRMMSEHLASLRRTLTQFHAMEMQMVDRVAAGRIVSDSGLRARQQMLGEQTAMLLQMLEQTMQATADACPQDEATDRKDAPCTVSMCN